MYKLAVRLLLALIWGGYIFFICLIPLKLYKLNLVDVFDQIFPAIDIAILYYFSSYSKIRYWLLFLIGMILDQIYQMPTGSNSLVIITANLVLNYANRWFILKDEVTNILGFCIYSFFVISFRELIFLAKNDYNFQELSIYFYYITTILSYPILKFLMHKPSMLLTKHV